MSESTVNYREIIRLMFTEEKRLHTEHFGENRFLLFPVLIFVFSIGVTTTLSLLGISTAPLQTAFFILVFVFGLQTGTLVFIGQDALENVLGDTTFLIYSARTLPISRIKLLVSFIIKDVLYYTLFFIGPMALGLLPVVVLNNSPLTTVVTVFLALLASFLGGMLTTITTLSLARRTHTAITFAVVSVVGVGFLAYQQTLLAWTPYALLGTTSLIGALKGIIVLPVLFACSVLLYDPSSKTRTRTVESDFGASGRISAITEKTKIDVKRSSGGQFKLFFSVGLLAAVSIYLLSLIKTITGVSPSFPIAFGALLSIGTFAVYNWITQLDSPAEYTYLPFDIPQVFLAKRRAFAIFMGPVSALYYSLAVAFYPATMFGIIHGAIVHFGLVCYLYGVTTYIAGFKPNEFLFDTGKFLLFSSALAFGLIPPLVLSLVYPGKIALFGLIAHYIIVGGTGWYLMKSARTKWESEIRS